MAGRVAAVTMPAMLTDVCLKPMTVALSLWGNQAMTLWVVEGKRKPQPSPVANISASNHPYDGTKDKAIMQTPAIKIPVTIGHPAPTLSTTKPIGKRLNM